MKFNPTHASSFPACYDGGGDGGRKKCMLVTSYSGRGVGKGTG